MVFGPPNWTPKSLKFALKTKSKKREHREAKFHGFRSDFSVENRPKNVPVGEKQISWKTFFLLGKTKVFQPWSPPKIIKFAARNEDVKQSAETRNFTDFQKILTSKIDPKSDAERSQFCDAMQITRESAKSNGPHDFWTTNFMAIWLRKWLGFLDLFWMTFCSLFERIWRICVFVDIFRRVEPRS